MVKCRGARGVASNTAEIELTCASLLPDTYSCRTPPPPYSPLPAHPGSLAYWLYSKVELVDSGLDELGSETLLRVLLGRANTISMLDFSQNRIGGRGAIALARFISEKGALAAWSSSLHQSVRRCRPKSKTHLPAWELRSC